MGLRCVSTNLGRRAFLTGAVVGISGCTSFRSQRTGSKFSEQTGTTSWTMAGGTARNTSELDSDIGSRIDDVSWSESVASQFASPIVTTSTQAIVSTQSKILGFVKSDGTIAFSTSLPGGMAAAPAVTDNHVLVPRDTYGEGFDSEIDLESPKLYALDRETNRTAWSRTLDGTYLASVAVADDIYVQTDRETYRIQPDGTVTWRHAFDDSFDWRETLSYLRPVIGPDGVYVGHRNSLVKLDRTSGAVVWTRSVGKTFFPPVIADESIVIASTGRETVGLAPSEGRIRWRVSAPPVWAPASNGELAVLSTERRLLGITVATGERRWSVKTPLSTCPPVLAGGTVFAAPGGTNLVAVDAETGTQIDERTTDGMVEWITPDSTGLLIRQSQTEGPVLRRYPIT